MFPSVPSYLNYVHALFKNPVCCFVVAVSLFHDCTVCIMQISMYFCCTTPVAFFLKGRFLSLHLNYIFLFLQVHSCGCQALWEIERRNRPLATRVENERNTQDHQITLILAVLLVKDKKKVQITTSLNKKLNRSRCLRSEWNTNVLPSTYYIIVSCFHHVSFF